MVFQTSVYLPLKLKNQILDGLPTCCLLLANDGCGTDGQTVPPTSPRRRVRNTGTAGKVRRSHRTRTVSGTSARWNEKDPSGAGEVEVRTD